MSRTAAERIVDALEARQSGLLPIDFDEQIEADLVQMQERYDQLRISKGFSEANRIAKTEFVTGLLAEHERDAHE